MDIPRLNGFDAIKAVNDVPQGDQDDGLRRLREDVYRKNILKRVGLRLEKFVQPNRTEEELYNHDIPVGPEMDRLTTQDHLIKIIGGDGSECLLSNFDNYPFLPAIRRNMLAKNIVQPTLIQKAAIPIIIAKKDYDLVGRAQTGTGKTAAFLLPIIDELCKLKSNRALSAAGPFALIVAPTRELAQQLGDAAKAYTRELSLSVVTTYGETSVYDAIREIRRGNDILVATPGRLKQFINEKILKVNTVKWLILDEADKLMQDQFSKDIALLKDSLVELSPNHRTFMFSATFDATIQYLAEKLLNPNFFFISVGSENVISETVQQNFIEAKGFKKVEILHTLLMQYSRGSDIDSKGLDWDRVTKTLIFCNTRRKTNWLALQLSLRGIKTMCTNGDRTQKQRQEAIDLFEKDEVDVLVSTNVTARGLNILGVSHIINYELPKDYEDYVHRIGRTGRVGNHGLSTSFVNCECSDDRKVAKHIVYYLGLSKQPIPAFLQALANNELILPPFNGK